MCSNERDFELPVSKHVSNLSSNIKLTKDDCIVMILQKMKSVKERIHENALL